ncbi:MAG: hypothetical protein AAFV26_11210 [Pseudomonadota bacterium]
MKDPGGSALRFWRKREDHACEIEVSHTFESLHAHVELAGNVKIEPGDEVIVHGSPIEVPYGEIQRFSRTATVIRAPWYERAWTRLTGDFEFMELCEFSFSEEGRL